MSAAPPPLASTITDVAGLSARRGRSVRLGAGRGALVLLLLSSVVPAQPAGGISGEGYRQIQEDGTGLSFRKRLNFTGNGVTCTDDAAGSRTNCAVNAGNLTSDAGTTTATQNFNVAGNLTVAGTVTATASPLLAKAWGYVTGPCDGAAAAGTACTVSDSFGVTSVKSNGVAGSYRVDLSYSPPNANYVILATSHGSFIYCIAHTHTATTGDGNGTNFIVECRTDAAVASNTFFSFMVFDS